MGQYNNNPAQIFKKRFYYALPLLIGAYILFALAGHFDSSLLESIGFKGALSGLKVGIDRANTLREIHGGFYQGHYLKFLFTAVGLGCIYFFLKILFPNLKLKRSKKDSIKSIFRKFDLIQIDKDGNETIPQVIAITDKSFIIKDCFNDKNLAKYLHGLIETLKQEKVINFNRGELNETGYPGRYIVEKVGAESSDISKDFFLESGWYKKEIVNGIAKQIYPSVKINRETETVTVHLKGVRLTENKVVKHLALFEKHLGLDLDDQFENNKETLKFKILKELPQIFQKGDVNHNFDTWYDSVVVPMKEYDHEHWFCGEVNDQNIKFDSNLVFFSAASSAHTAVIGMTGSGKTKTLIHICIAAAAAYPKAKWYFGCGKSGADLAPLANRLSDYPLAILDNKSEDTSIQFANIINSVWKEYVKRQAAWAKARELGYNPSTYLELRKIAIENDLPELYFERCYLVIDELKAYWDISCGEPTKYVNEKDTIPNMINRLLAEGRSYGISIVLASQDYKYTTFPTIMRGNLTTQFIHKQETKNCQFVEIPDADQLNRGEYFLRANGLMDNRGASLFRMKMPYIGDDPEQVLDKLGFKLKDHKQWDYDLIYNRGGGLDFEKIDILQLSKIIRQAFLKREGYEIEQKHGSDERYLSTFIYDPGRNTKMAVGIIKSEDTDIDILKNNIKIECENDDLLDVPKIFFIFGDKTISKWKDILSIFYKFNAIVISQTQYSKLLKQAYTLYDKKESKFIFRRLLHFLLTEQSKSQESQIDQMYGGETVQDVMDFFGGENVGGVNEIWGIDKYLDEGKLPSKSDDPVEDGQRELPEVGDSEKVHTPGSASETRRESTETSKRDAPEPPKASYDETRESLLESAIDVVKDKEDVSISFLQRKLKIGFNEASILLQELKTKGYLFRESEPAQEEVIDEDPESDQEEGGERESPRPVFTKEYQEAIRLSVLKKGKVSEKDLFDALGVERERAQRVLKDLKEDGFVTEVIKEDVKEFKRNTPYRNKLNIKTLSKILKIKTNSEKGDASEQFVLEVERHFGHDTYFMKELIHMNIVKFKVRSGRADGGIDLVRWVDKEKRKAIAIQVKAQPSRKIGTAKLDELVGCSSKFEGIEFVGFVFYNIDGYFSRSCKGYKQVQMINGDTFKQIVEKIESGAKNSSYKHV